MGMKDPFRLHTFIRSAHQIRSCGICSLSPNTGRDVQAKANVLRHLFGPEFLEQLPLARFLLCRPDPRLWTVHNLP